MRSSPTSSVGSLALARTPRAELARSIPGRPRASWWLTLAIAAVFAAVLVPIVTADRWTGAIAPGAIHAGEVAKLTVRLPPFAGYPTPEGRIGGNGAGVLIARGDLATPDDAARSDELAEVMPHGPAPYLAYFVVAAVLAGLFSYHARRSTSGRLARVQLVNVALIAATALAVKLVMLTTAISVLVVPVAAFALVPTLALDRVVGLATGVLAALVTAMLVPFDVGVAVLLLVQTSVAGLVAQEKPKRRLRAVLVAGGAATLLTALTYPLLEYLRTGHPPGAELADPMRSAWLAAIAGPALATVLAVVLVPAYQLLVGEITQGTLIELEDLSQPLLRQIAEKAPGTWQHSLMMANLAEIAANAIGANGKLVRVGAYYHDLGKSLHPKYFIENLEPGETSPHDQLPPEVSCDAIFAHVVEGLSTARKAGLHERIVDFMHMHHGDGVLEYFWAKCQEQGNAKGLTASDFRYPGVRPQTRETAILAICDAVEAASRTIKKADNAAIASLVQRIVYGKLHLGQLDESGLSMRDLRVIADSLRETIRHANHGRIEYPWQKAGDADDASAVTTTTSPRLDSLDRPARPPHESEKKAKPADALADTDLGARKTERLAPAPAPVAIEDLPVTAPYEKAEPELEPVRAKPAAVVVEPRRDLKVSRDGLPRVEHARPSDGDVRADAAAVESIDNEPDTGKHRATKLAATNREEIAQFTAEATRAIDAAQRDGDTGARAHTPSSEPAQARKRAATLPPTSELLRPPSRRAPTVPPIAMIPPRAQAVLVDGEADLSTTAPRLARAATTPPADVDPATTAPGLLAPVPRAPRTRSSAPDIDPATGARPTPTSLPSITVPAAVPPRDPSKPTPSLPLGSRAPAKLTPSAFLGDTARAASPSTPPPARAPTASTPPINVPLPPLPSLSRTTSRSITAQPDPSETPATSRITSRSITVPPDPSEAIPKPIARANSTSSPFSLPLEPSVVTSAPKTPPATVPDAAVTAPAMPAAKDLEASRPSRMNVWAAGLAARIDAQISDDGDDEPDFGSETPVSAPTRAELQALLDAPPDTTRKLSVDEVERLHQQKELRPSQPELELTRRAPYPTAEVREEDIEAAIEIAPSARRPTAIGFAKKKPSDS